MRILVTDTTRKCGCIERHATREDGVEVPLGVEPCAACLAAERDRLLRGAYRAPGAIALAPPVAFLGEYRPR